MTPFSTCCEIILQAFESKHPRFTETLTTELVGLAYVYSKNTEGQSVPWEHQKLINDGFHDLLCDAFGTPGELDIAPWGSLDDFGWESFGEILEAMGEGSD